MKQQNRQFFVFPPVMVMSVYFTALGFLVPRIQEKFLLSSAQVGLFSTMQSIGTFAALLICFLIVSAMNKTRVFLISGALFAACLFFLVFNQLVILMYVLFILIGLFTGVASTLSNSLLVDSGTKHAGYYIGILHGVWAGTAALGPFFVLMFSDDYKTSLLWLGFLAVGSLAVYALGLRDRLKMPIWEDKSKIGSPKKLFRTFFYKGMPVLLVIGFLTTIIRSGFTFFLRSYIEYLGRQPIFGAYIIGVFFIGMFIGRMAYGKLSHSLSANRVLLVTNIVALLAFAAMVLIDNMIIFIILMSIGALCISTNVPIMITKSYEIMPSDSTGATSFFFISVVTGSLVGPPIIGWLGDVTNMRIAMLCCISVLLPIIAIGWNMLRSERLEKRELKE